ncbi:MAG TPA: hypothetical protein PK014_10000 [Thermoanaerobaculia bacterium]|nr:hypothetical protein [Thermoanaerobaculia bacterium]HUM30450.1 hypothetical protein [Thermoanaerobaculia bacterium]HXK68683.1 hypothetical protein [Thermoanaerobaculia bacterium]
MKGENLFLSGKAGDIECQIQYSETCNHTWVVLHPHPLYGGKMNLPILYHLRKSIHDHQGATLSFNFRGVGLSGGHFTGGPGELEDALVACEYLRLRFPELPVSVLGYSFGALIGLDMAKSVSMEHLVLIGFPLTFHFQYPVKLSTRRLIAIQGEKDEFGRPADIQRTFGEHGLDAEVIPVEASDHFFQNHLFDLISTFTASVYGGEKT